MFRAEAVGISAGSTTGTTISASGTNNTKSGWTQLIASTTVRANFVLIELRSGADGDFLIDIGIGGAGSEQVLIPNLQYSRHVARWSWQTLAIIEVPAGSRLSARVQSTTGANTGLLALHLFYSDLLKDCKRNESWGAATADSGGTGLDPGGSANTKSGYTQIIASTTFRTKWAIISIGNQNNSVDSTAQYLIDIAVGGAGSEQIVVPNLFFQGNSDIDTKTWFLMCIPLEVPAGSRVSVNPQSDITDATDRKFDIVFSVFG